MGRWERPWTQNSVREARKKAKALIAERAEIDASEDDDVHLQNGTVPVAIANDVRPESTALPERPLDENAAAEARMKSLPNFGMF